MLKKNLTVCFHFLKPCNFRCKYCYQTFQDIEDAVPAKGFLDEKKLVSLTQTLAKSFQKITFAGGEPTICSFLPRLMSVAREEGVLVNVITNGSLINEEWITKNAKLIDLLTVSIDSDKPETHSALGRCFGGVEGKTCSNEHYLKLGEACRKNGIKVKMNTVVTEINKNENMTNFITALRPYRWKILQAMPVKGQNDEYIGQLTPSLSDFNKYVEFHKKVFLFIQASFGFILCIII
jgi:radical S-adenosyl methionine domain-containing protein 2